VVFPVPEPVDSRQVHDLKRLKLNGFPGIRAFDVTAELDEFEDVFGFGRDEFVRRILTFDHIQEPLAS
jgi:hypothetical protein